MSRIKGSTINNVCCPEPPEQLTPLFSPLDEQDRKGERYALKFKTELGLYGVNWWPLSRKPEEALEDFGVQLMLLPDVMRLAILNQCAVAVAQTMYAALCREADGFNKPPTPRG